MERRSERRLVTCVFIDIVGSTDLTVRLGPERMKRLLDAAFAEISTIVQTNGGTVEKYIGDAVFVLFGAPVAHEDDVERALRSAAASTRRASAATSAITVRAGVETGEALVDLGAVEERQRMAVGPPVSLAARLQQEAEPGQVVVGPVCREAARGFASFEPLGERRLKGIGDVAAFRLIDVAPSRRESLPFVGRTAELAQIQDAFARARRGRATLVLLTGPPGQGKSRLVEEFLRTGGVLRTIPARCRPGGETGLLTAWRQLLGSCVTEPTPELVEARVADLIGEPSLRARVTTALCHSAGVLVDQRLMALHPREREDEIVAGWREFLGALAREAPTVVWLEDLHWAEQLLIRLVDRASTELDAPLFVVATARPEFAGLAMLRPTADRVFLELAGLSPDEARSLALSAAQPDERIVSRAEGNPLFIIELSRSGAAELPVTIRGAIAASLDALPSAERELLQRAAVAGETFDVRSAALLADQDPASAAAALGRLAHLRYIVPVDAGYRFHHTLVRDIAYGRIPIADRLRLHARYAREGVHPDDLEGLAEHWWRALEPPDAAWVWEGEPEIPSMRRAGLRAHLRAADRLFERGAPERAIAVAERALAIVERPEETAEAEAALGLLHYRNAQGDESWEHQLKALQAYKSAGAPAPASLYAQALLTPTFTYGYFRRLPDEREVARLLDEGLATAKTSADRVSFALLLVERANSAMDASALNEALGIVDASADITAFASVLPRLGQAQALAGEVDAARRTFARLEALDVQLPVPQADVLLFHTHAAYHAGDLGAADALSRSALSASAAASAHTKQHAYGARALALVVRGDWVEARTRYGELTELVRRSPGIGFCLIGAGAAAAGAIAEAVAGRPLPDDLEAFVERLVPESEAVRASALIVPFAMVGRSPSPASLAAYGSIRQWDRQLWDPIGANLAIALTILERWDALDPVLKTLESFAPRGARLATALAAAIREEMAAARGGPRAKHKELRDLGYVGLSQLVSFRPTTRGAASRSA